MEGLETPGRAESPHASESMTRKAEMTRRSARRVDEEEKEGRCNDGTQWRRAEPGRRVDGDGEEEGQSL